MLLNPSTQQPYFIKNKSFIANKIYQISSKYFPLRFKLQVYLDINSVKTDNTNVFMHSACTEYIDNTSMQACL